MVVWEYETRETKRLTPQLKRHLLRGGRKSA